MINKQSILLLGLLLIGGIYSIGSQGPFLYDDSGTLRGLSEFNQAPSLQTAKEFIITAKSGPSKRPVSMSSFLSTSESWPDNPFSFKLINVLLHLLNTVFIFLFLQKLQQRWSAGQSKLLAILIALIWLAHPLHISTVLYVSQRMTLLFSLFTLLGCLSLLKAMELQQSQKIKLKHLLVILSIPLTVLLSMLSKESGINSVFALALILYFSKNTKVHSTVKFITLVSIILPLFFLISYLVVINPNVMLSGFEYKGFTFTERLLTEFRVFWMYVSLLVYPNINLMTLYGDSISISDSIFTPISTLTSIIGLLAYLVVSTAKIIPLQIRFGLLWFIAFHLLETFILPLYIYFEHRNYLASLGLIIAVVYSLKFLIAKLNTHKENIYRVNIHLSVFYFIVLIISTYKLNVIWSDEETLYTHWLSNNPKSVDTFITYVQYHEKQSGIDLAYKILKEGRKHPHINNDLAFNIKLFTLACILNQDEQTQLNRVKILANDANNYTRSVHFMYASLTMSIIHNKCAIKMPEHLVSLSEKILNTAPEKNNPAWKKQINANTGYALLHLEKQVKALSFLSLAYDIKYPDIALAVIDTAIRVDKMQLALKWLNKIKRDLDKIHDPHDRISQSLEILEKKLTNANR